MRRLNIIAIIFVLAKPMKLLVCPAPYLAVGSGCYYITLQTGITWDQAFSNCALDIKGYLAEVESEQEQNDIASLLRAADNKSEYAYWIGAADIQEEGEYRWMTSGKPVMYAAWAKGEPNNDHGKEDCIHMQNYIYLWNDNKCEDTEFKKIPMKGICEVDPIIECSSQQYV